MRKARASGVTGTREERGPRQVATMKVHRSAGRARTAAKNASLAYVSIRERANVTSTCRDAGPHLSPPAARISRKKTMSKLEESKKKKKRTDERTSDGPLLLARCRTHARNASGTG